MCKYSKLEMKSMQARESRPGGPAQTLPFPATWTVLAGALRNMVGATSKPHLGASVLVDFSLPSLS